MTNRESQARLSARVTGRVQGVGFRYFTRRQATRLGLTGWVRNQPDGSVELVAEGSRDALEALLAALQEGPPTSRVTRVQPYWSEASGSFSAFNVRYF